MTEAGQLETSIRIVECLLSLFRCQKRPVCVRPLSGRQQLTAEVISA